MQQVIRYHNAKGSLLAGQEGKEEEEEDKFDVLVDANDQLLEKAVCIVYPSVESSLSV